MRQAASPVLPCADVHKLCCVCSQVGTPGRAWFRSLHSSSWSAFGFIPDEMIREDTAMSRVSLITHPAVPMSQLRKCPQRSSTAPGSRAQTKRLARPCSLRGSGARRLEARRPAAHQRGRGTATGPSQALFRSVTPPMPDYLGDLELWDLLSVRKP